MVASASSASQRSSSSVSWHPSKHMNVTVTEKIPTSTTTIVRTIFQSDTSTTTTSSAVFSPTSTVDPPPIDSNSISDTRVLQQSTSSSLFSTTFVSSSLPIETTDLPLSTVDPTPTTSGMIVSTFVTASTDSNGVHTFTEVTTIAHFQPSGPSSTPENDLNTSHHGSSPNVPMIILIILGVIGFCALALLFIWWCKGRRRRGDRDNHIYPFSGGTEILAGRQFGRACGKRPYSRIGSNPRHTINRATDRSFGNSRERGATPTPFLEQTRTDVLVIGNPGVSSPRVRFDKLVGDSEKRSEYRTERRTREGTSQRDRPPTYITELATIATSLPLYSVVDPSPSSETCTTPTTSTPMSPLAARRSQPARFSQHTPFGRKF